MAAVALDGAEVVVRLSPLEKMGALHGDVRLPRAAVLAGFSRLLVSVADPEETVRLLSRPSPLRCC